MTSMSLLLDLPAEVLLAIASLSDVPAIVSLRKTCTLLNQLSHDRSLWLAIISRQKYDLPLPQYTHELSSLLEIPTSKLEEVAVSAHNVHHYWLLPRSPKIHAKTPKLSPTPGQFLLSLEIFLERWLLCVYREGHISLWDIGTTSSTGREGEGGNPGSFCMRHQRSAVRGLMAWSSCVAAVDVGEQSIVLACKEVLGHLVTTEIYRIALPGHSSQPSTAAPRRPIEIIAEVAMISHTHFARAIFPAFKLIAFSHGCFIDIFNWETKKNVTIPAGRDDLEELNGVVALRFFPPYILCVGIRTVELHQIPQVLLSPEHQNPTSADLPTLSHSFPETTIRDVSISTIHPSSPSSSISILAYDVHRGLFHYNVHLQMLNVQLLGMYNLASSTAQNHMVLPGSTRGFISAFCLGKQGKRSVWIERERGSTRKSIFVFEVGRQDGEMAFVSRDRPETMALGVDEDGDAGGMVGMRPENKFTNGKPITHPATIDGKIVYEIGSYDLREDVTHCAFSEVSGRIVLGNRAGDIMVL